MRLLSISLVIATCLVAPILPAQSPPVAAELFRAGAQAFERGDFQAAALSFEQAYEHAPEPATAYSAGLSWFSAGNQPRAADAYERALTAGSLDQERSTQARARLEALRNVLGVIRVLAPSGERASLGYRSAALIPFSVYVRPGEHQATLVTGENPATERMRVAAGEVTIVRFAPRPSAGPKSPPVGSADASAEPGLSPWWSVAAFAVSAGSVGGALVFRTQALNSIDEFEASGERSARDAALTQRTLSYGFWGLAGVSAATGVTLLLWPTATPERGNVALSWNGSQLSGLVRF